MAPTIKSLDRLKAQLLTSGIQERNQPLFQVINQLIDYLRQGIDSLESQITAITPSSGGGGGTTIITGGLAYPLPLDGEDGESIVGPPGPQGIQGPVGPIGPPGMDGECDCDGMMFIGNSISMGTYQQTIP